MTGCSIPRSGLIAVLAVALAVPAATQLLAPVEGEVARLEQTELVAAGSHHTLLHVARFGRFTLAAKSEQGVALQLVDRMAGPGQLAGVAGGEDGRLDLFLDRGDYRVVTSGHEKASGPVTLSVSASRELSQAPAPQLVELKLVTTTLADLEQRSFWLEVSEPHSIALEAAGRALADLRLWRDGVWLEAAEPQREVLEPREGQPLAVCRIAVNLEAGLYLVTAYGGREQPWAAGGTDYPLYLRLGLPALPIAGRARHDMSPFGVDRYRLPAKANLFRLELPQPRSAELEVSDWDESTPFATGGDLAGIDKNSREPAAELELESRDEGERLLTVRAEAGQPYILQHFEQRDEYHFDGSGQYWLSTVHTGHPEDSVDATGFVADWDGAGKLRRDPFAEQTVLLDADHGWATRCNLLDPLTVFLHVGATGTYTVDSRGVSALFRIEPFFVYRPADYRMPPSKPAGAEWELDAGFYVLTVLPEERGILDIAVHQKGLLAGLLDLVGADKKVAAAPVRASVRFPAVSLESSHSYVLYLNRQPGVQAGVVLRPLPLDLGQALPLTLVPGEKVDVPFTASEPVRLEARAEDGSPLALGVDSGALQASGDADAGAHTVTITNRGTAAVVCSLEAVPVRLLAASPLPPLPEATLAGLPELPVLAVASPQLFDLDREAQETFLLRSEADALYRVESTGLLSTTGTLRSRVVTDLASSESGGTGRNFLLHQYLREGDYQVTVTAQGRSTGHLGLTLTRTDPLDGGALAEGVPARVALGEGESVVYRFSIAEAADYRLRALAAAGQVTCRLEDGDGWPLVEPGLVADVRRRFEPGEYRLFLLPQPVAGRRVTLLERIVEPAKLEGHGPHRLELAKKVTNTWMEPEAGQERVPDVFLLELPGPCEVTVTASNEMAGRLAAGHEVSGETVGEVLPGKAFKKELPAGPYRLELTCSRRNNRLEYDLQVDTSALVAGGERLLSAPVTIPVAVGHAGLLELYSLGASDVRARLEDASGTLVAVSDDRPQDWNFHIATRLEPGAYTLTVIPVGASSAETLVKMEARPEVSGEPLTLPAALALSPGAEVHLYPLPQHDGVLVASARSDEAVGLAVEAKDGAGWKTVASRTGTGPRLELPAGGELRLRVWSVDRRGLPLHLDARAVRPTAVSEAELGRGARLEPVAGLEPPLALAEVKAERPGVLRLSGEPAGVRWSGLPDAPLEPVPTGALSLPSGRGLLAVDASGPVTLKASRVRLKAGGEPVQLPLSRQPLLVDLEPGDGPLVAMATAMVGQPAVRVVAAGGKPQPLLDATAVAPQAAVSVALDGRQPVLEAWLADPDAGPAEARLRQIALRAAAPGRAALGLNEGELAAGRALALELPPGASVLELAGSPGLVATIARGDEVLSVHWGGTQPLSETVAVEGGTLWLLAVGDAAVRYAVELRTAEDAPLVVTAEQPYLTTPTRAGTVRLGVRPGGSSGLTLRLLGESAPATLLGTDGTVRRGSTFASGAGTLLLPHGAAPVMAWLEPEGDTASALWQGVEELPAETVSLPFAGSLGEAVRTLRVEVAAPTLLTVRRSAGAVLRLQAGGSSRSWASVAGGVDHLPLEAGSATLSVRPLESGELELVGSPITDVGEGLGPEVLLPPGGGHVFRFRVTTAGPVGVGVRAEADTVDCELLADGKSLGSGVVQMHDLKPGEYLLVLHLPAGGEPVRARPAVVGIVTPSTGPPEEVIRQYLDMERSQL